MGDKYLEKQKLDKPPGAMVGSLARDMNQGGIQDHGEPPMNLTKMLRNPGPGNTGGPPVTAKLRNLLKQ